MNVTLRMLRTIVWMVCIASLGSFSWAQDAEDGEPPRTSGADALIRLLPAGAESMLVIPSVPELLRSMRETPFGEIYANPRYRTLLGPLVSLLEIDNPELGASLRSSGGNGTMTLPGALLVAEFPRFRGHGEKTPRVALYEIPDGDAPAFLELMLVGSDGPGSRVNRLTPPVAGRSVIAVQTLREIRESIELKGEARKYRRDMLRDRGLSEDDLDFRPVATRRELTEELFFAGPDYIVHCSGGRPFMEAILKRADLVDEPSGMAVEKKWRSARNALASSPQLLLYRDLRPEQGSKRRKLKDDDYRLGLNEIRSIVAGLDLRADRLAFEIAVYVPEPRLGIGKLLFINEPVHEPQFEAAGFLPVVGYDRDPTALIPADAVGYSAFSADMARLWTDAYRILQAGAPDIAELLDIYFQTQGAKGDFATNFASTFGSRWITFSRFPAESGGSSNGPEMTALLEVKNAEALGPVLEQWIQNLSQLLNVSVEQYTVSGRRYFRLEGAEALDPRLTPLGPIGYICLAERWLILSVRQEHILAALARLQSRSARGGEGDPSEASPLLSDPGYARLRSGFPSARFFEAYALPVANDQVMISPIMLLLSEALNEASNSLIELDEAPREDIWRDAFGTMGMAMRTSDQALVADMALMYEAGSE